MYKLISITELSKILNIDSNKKNILNHTLRYWEKEFKQLKPKIIKKRRYYTYKQVEAAKLIKFLLKDKGMTIKGVKKLLDNKINQLDVYSSYSLKTEYYKRNIKTKNILEKINKLKRYGKKNTH